MKTSTKLALGAIVAAAVLAWQYDRNHPDGRAMERLHAQEGVHRMSCTESEYAGERWMACRYPDQDDRGSLWVWSPDTFDGAWIPRNNLAHRVNNGALERARQGEDLPGVAIAALNPLAEENREWLHGLPGNPWPHLD